MAKGDTAALACNPCQVLSINCEQGDSAHSSLLYQAGDRIRGSGDSDDNDDEVTPWYPENPEQGASRASTVATTRESPAAAVTATATAQRQARLPAAASSGRPSPAATPPRSNAASSRDAERPAFAGPRGRKGVSRGTRKVDARAGDEETWSPLDMAVRPLQAFAGVVQKQVRRTCNVVIFFFCVGVSDVLL